MKRTITPFAPALLMTIACIATGSAQTASPTFEVVSVKPSTSNEPGGRMSTLPGRVTAQNLTLRNLIVNAYGVRDTQVDTSSAPSWVTNERFDIDATMAATATPEQVSKMMQALLADRFKLAVRMDTRNAEVYSLAPARSDGTLGPAMKPAQDPQCAGARGANVGRQGGPPAPRCGGVLFSPGRLVGTSASWQQLVNALSRVPAVGRQVVDGGGKSGTFDFELRWMALNRGGGPGAGGPAGPGPGAAETASDLPDSIFTALQEQLGLKLTPTEAPLPMIVVTDARRPEAN